MGRKEEHEKEVKFYEELYARIREVRKNMKSKELNNDKEDPPFLGMNI